MRRFLRLALSALLLWTVAAPAKAAIGTPTYLGGASDATNTVTTITITTGASAPAGNLIVVAVLGQVGIATSPTVTDSALNTYTLTAAKTWSGSNKLYIAYCENPVLLSSGGTIVVAWTGVARVAAAAASVSGLATASAIDISGAGTTGTGTSDSIATGTLAQASEIIFGITGLANTSAGYAPTGVTNILTAPTQGNNSTMLWAYEIVSATTGVTYAPAWTTSRTFGSNVYSFKAPGATSVKGSLTTLGCCQ